jgi:hypothetical protein
LKRKRVEIDYVNSQDQHSDLADKLDEDRQSDPPDLQDQQWYAVEIAQAPNKTTVQAGTFQEICKSPKLSGVEGYGRYFNMHWTSLDNELTDGLRSACPGYYESLDCGQYPAGVRSALGQRLQPSSEHGHAMARLCVEFRRARKANAANAQREAAHRGAIMVEAAWAQHKFSRRRPEAFLGATQTLTATYNGRALRVFANCATAREGAGTVVEAGVEYPDRLVFHQRLLRDVCMTSRPRFLEARKIFRNAQDWARGQAVETRDALAAFVAEAPPVDEGRDVDDRPAKRRRIDRPAVRQTLAGAVFAGSHGAARCSCRQPAAA